MAPHPDDDLSRQVRELHKDFRRGLSALSAMHSGNEDRIDELDAAFAKFVADTNDSIAKIDRRLLIIETERRVQHDRADNTPIVVPIHAAHGTPPAGVPAVPDPHKAPDVATWLTQTKALLSQVGGAIFGIAALVMAGVQQCNAVEVRRDGNHNTVITVPSRSEESRSEDRPTTSAPHE